MEENQGAGRSSPAIPWLRAETAGGESGPQQDCWARPPRSMRSPALQDLPGRRRFNRSHYKEANAWCSLYLSSGEPSPA